MFFLLYKTINHTNLKFNHLKWKCLSEMIKDLTRVTCLHIYGSSQIWWLCSFTTLALWAGLGAVFSGQGWNSHFRSLMKGHYERQRRPQQRNKTMAAIAVPDLYLKAPQEIRAKGKIIFLIANPLLFCPLCTLCVSTNTSTVLQLLCARKYHILPVSK